MREAIVKTLVVAAVALVALVPPALAEGELGVQGGLLFADEHISNQTGLLDGLAPTVGVRGLYRFPASWGLFLDVNYSFTDTTLTTAGDGDAIAYRAGVEFPLGSGGSRGEWFITGGGGLVDVSFSDASTLDFDRTFGSVSLGQRYEMGDRGLFRWEARLDHAIDDDGLNGENVDNVYFLLGYGFRVGAPPRDSDGDGVRDGRDKCPDTPKGAVVDEVGCPKDSDGDGVWDGIDKCPDTPQGWPVDASGCPKDSDGDGVPDGRDKCPDTPKGAIVDENGCPKDTDGDGVWDGIDKCPDTPKGATVDATGCPKDSDGDGVLDGIDQCPGTPKGAIVDATGCPKDSDGDGVWDGIDKCPDTPKGTPVDGTGCPKQDLFQGEGRTLVLEGVNFDTNSANLKAESNAILDRVAKSLNDWPQIRVEIAGHTDSVGSETYNRTLSQRRADSVKKHLVDKGVAAERLTTKGYGEAEPIADNGNDAGRAKNRRVELRRLD